MKHQLIVVLFTLSTASTLVAGGNYTFQEVVYSKEHTLKGYLARPSGEGPLPTIIYHHGGLGAHLGGSPKETSIALARAGYVGFSPLRRRTRPMKDAIEDADAAMAFINRLDYVDKKRLAVLGFSRGGHLAFYNGAKNPGIKAMVIMACAPGRRNQSEFFAKVRDVKASVLLLVAENDNERTDLVALIKKIKQTLDEEHKDARLIVYPPYKNDGHRMFFEIGAYWKDVIKFLDEKVKVADEAIDSDKT